MRAAMLELSCLDILRYINDALGFCIDVVGVALLRCIFALYACTAVLHCAFAWENFKIGRKSGYVAHCTVAHVTLFLPNCNFENGVCQPFVFT